MQTLLISNLCRRTVTIGTVVLVVCATLVHSAVTLYPGVTEEKSAIFTVTVDGQSSFVYDGGAAVGGNTIPGAFTNFSFSGSASIAITPSPAFFTQGIKTVVIRPSRCALRPVVSGGVISFTIQTPGQYVVEINGDRRNTFMIFANPPEQYVLPAPGPNFLSYGPGVHELGSKIIDNTDNLTIYVAGGALVRGKFGCNIARNIKILGRGIIKNTSGNALWMKKITGLTIDGPIIWNHLDQWTCYIISCDSVRINNVKVLASIRDGFDLTSCTNLTLTNSFAYSWDDAFCLKATNWSDNRGRIRNNVIADCIAWTGNANGLEIGYESMTDSISGVRFRNIDIPPNGATSPWPPRSAMAIHVGDAANVHDVVYDSIRIEEPAGSHFIDLRIWPDYATTDATRGTISDIVFRNIRVFGASLPPTALHGWDASHGITNVTFENWTWNGNRILSKTDAPWIERSDGGGSSQYVYNVTFASGPSLSPPAAPTMLAARALNDVEVLLTWSGTTADADYYSIERRTDGGTYAETDRAFANRLGYIDVQAVSAKTHYTYRVRGKNSGGFSAYSNESSVTTDSVPNDFDPLGYWQFDGNLSDAMGKYPGQGSGAIAFDSQIKKSGSALALSGVGRVGIGSLPLGNRFTISVWAFLDSTVNDIQTIVANGGAGATSEGFRLFVNSWQTHDGLVRFESQDGSLSSVKGAFHFGSWNHIAVVIDPAGGSSRLYVNGSREDSTGSYAFDFNKTQPVQIGCMTGDAFFYKGRLDELVIYDRALTNSQIQRLAGGEIIRQKATGIAGKTQPGRFVRPGAARLLLPFTGNNSLNGMRLFTVTGQCVSSANRKTEFSSSVVRGAVYIIGKGR